jgi:hypothetical protein
MPNRNPLEIAVENEETKRRPDPTQARKPYVKPTFRYQRVFETQALSCGKIGGESQCHRNRKTS